VSAFVSAIIELLSNPSHNQRPNIIDNSFSALPSSTSYPHLKKSSTSGSDKMLAVFLVVVKKTFRYTNVILLQLLMPPFLISEHKYGKRYKFNKFAQKIDIDKKARYHYQVGCWFRLIDASICWDRDQADTQFAIFAWLALKKQCFIFQFRARGSKA
jgi:hypothetical protein